MTMTMMGMMVHQEGVIDQRQIFLRGHIDGHPGMVAETLQIVVAEGHPTMVLLEVGDAVVAEDAVATDPHIEGLRARVVMDMEVMEVVAVAVILLMVIPTLVHDTIPLDSFGVVKSAMLLFSSSSRLTASSIRGNVMRLPTLSLKIAVTSLTTIMCPYHTLSRVKSTA